MTKPSWLGPPIEEDYGRKFFKNCRISSGERISTGDYVHLIPADLCMEKYIGRIESMHEDESALKYIQIRWFYRPQDLQHQPPSQPLDNEVYHTSYYDCQLVESIVGRCLIKHKQGGLCIKTRKTGKHTSQSLMDVYTCRFSYCAEVGQFMAIQEEDLEGNLSKCFHGGGKERADGSINYEDIAFAKKLSNALLEVDRNVPREVASADWSTAKRLPWVLRAKNALTLDDLKQLLIDLESGLEIFKHQRGWRKSVQAISSFNMLTRYIQCLKLNAQRKVDDTFKKLRKTHSNHQNRKQHPGFFRRSGKCKWSAIKNDHLADRQGCVLKSNEMCGAFAIEGTHLPSKSLEVLLSSTPLSMEKHTTEQQTDELWKFVEAMQDDVAVVLENMGFSRAILQPQFAELGSENAPVLTEQAADDELIESVSETASKENILLFHMAAQVPCEGIMGEDSAVELSSPASGTHSLKETATLSEEKKVISTTKEEQEGCGFRIWKPQIASSSVMRSIACLQSNSNEQMNVSRPVLV